MVTAHDINSEEDTIIKDEIEITDSESVLIILNEKRKQILKLLLNRAMTIRDLKNETKINPGTIKRHIDKLMEHKFVFLQKEETTDNRVVMKFYRATARSFLIKYRID